MLLVKPQEAPDYLTRLIAEASATGEDVVISRGGELVARIEPVAAALKPRQGGQWRGKVVIREDFDAPLPDDILKAFYGGPVHEDPPR